MLEFIAGFFTALTLVWFIHGLTRPKEMREDQYREGGELGGHIIVKDWNKED